MYIYPDIRWASIVSSLRMYIALIKALIKSILKKEFSRNEGKKEGRSGRFFSYLSSLAGMVVVWKFRKPDLVLIQPIRYRGIWSNPLGPLYFRLFASEKTLPWQENVSTNRGGSFCFSNPPRSNSSSSSDNMSASLPEPPHVVVDTSRDAPCIYRPTGECVCNQRNHLPIHVQKRPPMTLWRQCTLSGIHAYLHVRVYTSTYTGLFDTPLAFPKAARGWERGIYMYAWSS